MNRVAVLLVFALLSVGAEPKADDPPDLPAAVVKEIVDQIEHINGPIGYQCVYGFFFIDEDGDFVFSKSKDRPEPMDEEPPPVPGSFPGRPGSSKRPKNSSVVTKLPGFWIGRVNSEIPDEQRPAIPLERFAKIDRPFGLAFAPGSLVKDETLKQLAGCKQLRVLKLSGPANVAAGMGAFPGGVGPMGPGPVPLIGPSGSTPLPVTAAGLKSLAQLEGLQHLDLSDLWLSDPELREVCGTQRLLALNIAGADVTDAGLEELTRLPNLRALDLSGCPQLTDDGLKTLAKLTGLRSLRIAHGGEGDQPIAASNIQLLTKGSTPEPPPKLTDAGIKELAKLTKLRYLSVAHTGVGNDGLKALAALTQLQALDLSVCPQLAETGYGALAEFKNLRQLEFIEAPEDDGVVHLAAALPALEALSLDRSRFTQAGYSGLGKAKRLQRLSLVGTRVNDYSLRHMAPLPQLKWLNLAGCDGITDAGLKHLPKHAALEELSLAGNHEITGPGIAELAALKNLRTLRLDYCVSVSRPNSEDLGKLKSLKRLSLAGCPMVERPDVDSLREALPVCRIDYIESPKPQPRYTGMGYGANRRYEEAGDKSAALRTAALLVGGVTLAFALIAGILFWVSRTRKT